MHDPTVGDGPRAAARRFAPNAEPAPSGEGERSALEAVYGLVYLLPAVEPPAALTGSPSWSDQSITAADSAPATRSDSRAATPRAATPRAAAPRTAAPRTAAPRAGTQREPRILRVPITPPAIAIGSLALMIVVASLALNVALLRPGASAPHSPQLLVAAETAPEAYGTAFIDRGRLIILVSGLPEPAASVSYVAWWVAGGRATTLGRIDVDDGSGRLTTGAPEGNGAIQITIERNPRATEPDGPVVMFSVPR